MCNTIIGFDVDHNRFTFASSGHSHNLMFWKKMNFITERPRTRHDLNCLYLGPKFLYSVPETFENLEKDCFKIKYKNFLLNNYKE